MRKSKTTIKMFLDELPRGGVNVGENNINWKKSVGSNVKFIYDDIEGYIKIVGRIDDRLIIEYNGIVFEDKPIKQGNFLNGKIGYYINKISINFKIDIGKNIKDKSRNITILDREYRVGNFNGNEKWYKYTCNKCGNTHWIIENALQSGVGCNSCCNYNARPILGINTIWDTDRWMCDLGVTEEDAKRYTRGSGKRIKVICPVCGYSKDVPLDRVYGSRSIGCTCGDGFSYPEKFMYSVLKQLDIEFETQYSPEWADKKRYDFYIPSLKCIIETHGNQHYTESFNRCGGRDVKQEQFNDKEKRKLALNNEIKYYIELDCRESNSDWIKNNIIKSNLYNLLEVSSINWDTCDIYATSNIVKECCIFYENNKNDMNLTEMGNVLSINRNVLRTYLQKGDKYNWCKYNAKESFMNNSKKQGELLGKKLSKKVEVSKDGVVLGIHESCHQLERVSDDIYGVHFNFGRVACACRNGIKYKKYNFKYIL